MTIQTNIPLAPYTSLGCGGPAERLAICGDQTDIIQALSSRSNDRLWVLGYGTNSLIADAGLPGLTIMLHGGTITITDTTLTVDAGVWWDEVVAASVERELWGIETLSGIPSSVGAAITGNIAAYGQQVSDTLASIQVIDTATQATNTIPADALQFSYRASSLQGQPNLIVTQATFQLSDKQTAPLTYAATLETARSLQLDTNTLPGCRKAVLQTRQRAGSLYDPNDPQRSHTAGSFFKNPLVSLEQAKELARFDETGKTLRRLLQQNEIHGGDTSRVSAAHVLLAAGFKRGQTWGEVRLHPYHVLKIENTGQAAAQEIYDVARTIMMRVKERLGIDLIPEVKFLGDF